MQVHEVELLISAASEKQYPEGDLPEIALSGRSNVGKSSLINCILRRKAFARTSSKPGKTQLLNFYEMRGKSEALGFDGKYRIVDVPGYGFANVPKSVREKWGQMMEHYFIHRQPLLGVLLIIDSRHDPSKDDLLMWDWLNHLGVRLAVIVTKIDKLTRNQLAKQLASIADAFEMPDTKLLLPFSSETGAGREQLWNLLIKWHELREESRKTQINE